MRRSIVVPIVIQQHAHGLAILWMQRERCLGEPHYSLIELIRLDARLDANLDGLRIASDRGWDACCSELKSWSQPAEVFSAACLAWDSNHTRRKQFVMKAGRHCYDCSRALISSLAWLPDDLANPTLDRLLLSKNSFDRRIAIASCAIRGRDPGEKLLLSLESRDNLLQARALRAVGELSRRDLLSLVMKSLETKDPHVRFSAAWAAARLTIDERVNEILREVVQSNATDRQSIESPTSDQLRALSLVLRRLVPSAAIHWLNRLSQSPALLRFAVIGTGILGLPDSIPWLLQLMQTPALARIAGEAFTMITGLDLAAEKLDAPWPAGFTAGPTEDPADDNVAMDPDENLPWPDAAQLTAWWQKRSPDFQAGQRYLCGQLLTEDWLEHVLRHGYQRQRAAAALELALLRPDQPLFNVRAPGHRQQELLGLQ